MKANRFLLFVIFLIPTGLFAQFFEGSGNGLYHLGFKQGNEKHVTFGIDAGLADYFSLGMSFNYAFQHPIDVGISAEIRADFHTGYILDQSNSDILLGLHYRVFTAYGAHAIYQYAFTDRFGLYGRAGFNILQKEGNFFTEEFVIDSSPFIFEAGFIYRPTLSFL